MKITTKEAAARLGVQPRRITRLIERGIIAATKFGRDYAIDPAEIDRYAATRRPVGRPKKH